jgi:hypothetical protein
VVTRDQEVVMEAVLRQAIGIVEDGPFDLSVHGLCAAGALRRAVLDVEGYASPVHKPAGSSAEVLAFVCDANGFVGARDRRGNPAGLSAVAAVSNVMLDDLDWELHKRGHRFVRYADDGRIYVSL